MKKEIFINNESIKTLERNENYTNKRNTNDGKNTKRRGIRNKTKKRITIGRFKLVKNLE